MGTINPVDAVAIAADPVAIGQEFVGVKLSSDEPDKVTAVLYTSGFALLKSGLETLLPLTRSRGVKGNITSESFVVPLGKTFKISAIHLSVRNGSLAGEQIVVFNIRLNSLGPVDTASTILFPLRLATPRDPFSWDRFTLNIAEGIDIPGDGITEIGVSVLAVFGDAPTVDLNIIGTEY